MSAVLLNRAIERQNRTWTAMTEIRDRAGAENRDLTAEERQAWDAAETELNEASLDIERFERQARLDSVDRSRAVPTGGPGEDRGDQPEAERRYAEAFGTYLRGGLGRCNGEQQELLQRAHIDLRAAGTNPDPAGGYLVPEGFRNTLTETLKAYGGLFGLVDVITTATGQDLPWPTNDDTANEGEILGENQAVTEQDFTFGGKKLKAHIFSSKMTRVPMALLQDSGFDLETWLPRKLGERIGRRAARAWTVGTGVDQPEGITANVTVGKLGANGQTTSIIYNDLIDLEHSVDPAYRMNGRYVMHDQMLKVVRKLVDSQSRPLWVPVPAPGFPATINGFAYTVDNSMPVPGVSAKSLAFGDLRAGYVARQVLGIQTLRLAERYADFLQVGFLAFARMDGMVQDGAALRLYQHSAT